MNLFAKAKEFIAGAADKVGGNVIASLANVADEFIQTKEEKEAFLQAAAKEVNRHMEAMKAMDTDEAKAFLADVDSARNMQIEALKQTDTFSKRFIYYLASGVIFLVFVFDILLFVVKYPAENRDMINMIAGVLNSTALVMILSFFFGSSKGSKDGAERMDKMIDNMKK